MDRYSSHSAQAPASPADADERCASSRDRYDPPAESNHALLIQALRAARDEALAANRAKTDFIASVSHELRTPLNAILGFADTISNEQLGPIADKRYPGYAKDITKSARRLLSILSDIFDMARLESGRAHVHRETVALSDVVEEALAALGERVPVEAPPIQASIALQFPPLWTDRGHLRQILVHLLSNALAFTSRDGLIVISGHVAPSGDLEVVVANSGNGMTPEEIKRALTRFGHAEDELSRQHQGIGLGLPLAKSLASLLGGSMRIASSPGEGTAVTLSFAIESVGERAFEWKPPPDRMAERARRLLGKNQDEGIRSRRYANE